MTMSLFERAPSPPGEGLRSPNAARVRRFIAAAAIAALGTSALPGCGSGLTTYYPHLVARGELTLRYDNEFQLYAAGRQVANGYRYNGLPGFVRCVPTAHEHALAATSDGITGTTLSTLGIVFGVAGLGGLGGLTYYDSNPNLMFGLLGAGLASSVLGVVLAGVSRGYKNSANGHAVDAMNYYNDAVGSLGASCDDLVYPPPAGPAPPAVAAPPGGAPAADPDDDDATAPPPPPAPPTPPGRWIEPTEPAPADPRANPIQ